MFVIARTNYNLFMFDEYFTLQQARAAYCAGFDHVTNFSQSQ